MTSVFDMDYIECKNEFIDTWGHLATNWGESRTVGMVHALLLIACDPICTDQIMEELSISRGNASNTINHLIELGLLFKEDVPGERKDHFVAEKNMWKVMKAVIRERKKKELDPMIAVLNKLSSIEPSCAKSEEFHKTVKEIQDFSFRADRLLDTFSGKEMNWLMRSMKNIGKR
jgi:DNA-binding transcriptional regulator GbsR (MarR family)